MGAFRPTTERSNWASQASERGRKALVRRQLLEHLCFLIGALGGRCGLRGPARARPLGAPVRRWQASLRQIVETVHDRLRETFGLEHERPHDLAGFRTRLAAKVALHNLCLWLNVQL